MRRTLVLLFALATVACGGENASSDGGVPRADTGPTPARDAGTMTSISYTPEGCGYEVATPPVADPGMHEEIFGATASVDHVHVSWAGVPESTFAVNWRSDLDTLSSALLYGTDRAAVEAADGAGPGVTLRTGHFLRYSGSLVRTEARVHEVHVCGLEPSTTYYYKVGGPGHWSEVFEVSTAPPPGSTEAFSFAVTGDSRGLVDDATDANVWAMSQRRVRDRAVDFEIFTGDAVLLGDSQDQWNDWFEARDGDLVVQDLLATMPFMMTNGNHENLAVPFLAQFAFPQQTAAGEGAQGEEWYSFDYANAHFVVLNDTVADDATISGAERDWLEADLRAVDRAATPWIFAVHHRTLYTCESTHGPARELRAAWQPLFDELGVDMVLAGHNHVYERSRPVRGLSGTEGMVAPATAEGLPTFDAEGIPSGTIYVVSGGAGAPLYPVAITCETSLVGQATRNYAIVSIVGRSIEVTVYDTVTDAEIDSFSYTK